MRKSNFKLRNALSRYTSFVGSAATFPSEGKAHCLILLWQQRFYASVRAYPFFFLEERKTQKKKDRSGDCAAK